MIYMYFQCINDSSHILQGWKRNKASLYQNPFKISSVKSDTMPKQMI